MSDKKTEIVPKERHRHSKVHLTTKGKLDETAFVNFHLPGGKICWAQASRQVVLSACGMLVKCGMTIRAIPFIFFFILP